MTLPAFYDATKVGSIFTPATQQAIDAGRDLDIPPADNDTHRTALLLVDVQVDFVHEDGALSVPGAVDDTRRTIEWIYQHLDKITTIIASLDSHLPIQIFSPAWWIDADGKHPTPFTEITSSDVDAERWQPLYEVEWSQQYVHRLEEEARKQLMIWPYHTLTGTLGHNLVPGIYEAIAYHAAARQAQPQLITKGNIPKTEHYSLLEPEVKTTRTPGSEVNTALMDKLVSYDSIYIAGQAKSHCVLETAASLVRYFDNKPEVISRIHLLTDAMSSVAHPTIDFDAIANDTFKRFAAHGMNLVTTTDSLR